MTAPAENIGNAFGPDDGLEGKSMAFDGEIEGSLVFRVPSSTRPRVYVVSVRLDNGNVVCGYRLEGESDLLEGCEWCRYGHRGNVFEPSECCRHAKAVIERLKPILNTIIGKDLSQLRPSAIAALLALEAPSPSLYRCEDTL